jgi:tetratricopeptide (TPR) repeat protein
MYDQALKDLTAAIILNPMYSDAYLNRAKAYNEKGMKEEADKDFNEALKADPDKFTSYVDAASTETLFDEEPTSNKEIVAEHLQQGLEDLKNERYYEAVENFTEVINLSADNAQAYINRGQAYVELGQHDEAMVDLNRAVLYDPLNPSLYYWRALAWKGLDSPINLVADLKLSCELGYGPACEEYEKQKPQKH